MKLKNIIALILVLFSCLVCFTACGNNNETETPDVPAEKTEAEIIAECKKSLEESVVEVLHTEIVDLDNAHINGYGPYVTEFDKATIVVIGITFPDKSAKQLASVQLTGATNYNRDAKDIAQLWSQCAWISENNDYALIIHRIAGEHNVSKLNIELTGCSEETMVSKTFSNNGTTVGFENAKKHFEKDEKISGTDNAIINIKGRHYFVAKRYDSQREYKEIDSKIYFVSKSSFVLIPLEDGFTATLTKEDFELLGAENIENAIIKLIVNENGRVSTDNVKSQTTIEVEIMKEVVGETKIDNISDTLRNQIENEIRNIAKALSVKDKNSNKIYYFDEQK